jgi:excisionase family DNA binding protein
MALTLSPPRRGRPPKAAHQPLPWIESVAVALRIQGINPELASIEQVTNALNPSHRDHHLPWQQRVLLPVVPIVCDLIGVSKAQVYRLAQQGHLELVKSGGRTCAVTETVMRYLDQVRAAGWSPPVQPAQLHRAKQRRRIAREASPLAQLQRS